MLYQIHDIVTDTPIGEPAPLPAELVGLDNASLADLSWVDPALGFSGQGFLPVYVVIPEPVVPRDITAIAFLQRFTTAERVAIRASADPIIADYLDLLRVSTLVNLDNADTVQGVSYLVAQGLLTPERADALLA